MSGHFIHTSTKKREGFEGQRLIVLPKKVTTDFLARDQITRQVYITDIGYYPKALYHYVQRLHGVKQHIIIYCVEGRGWAIVDKKKIEILPSQFIVIPANTPHKYGSEENDPWTIYWVHFKGEISAYIAGLIRDHMRDYRPHLSYNEKRIKLFEEIYNNLEKGYSNDNLRYINMTFYHFLSSLLYEDKFNYADHYEKEDVIRLSIALMQRRIDTVLSVEDLAASADLCVSHFSSVFRKQTGYSPIEYFNHLKVQKACQYLAFSDMTIKEMASRLGVDDQYYFSRMFSKLMGMPPKEYRKRNKSDNK